MANGLSKKNSPEKKMQKKKKKPRVNIYCVHTSSFQLNEVALRPGPYVNTDNSTLDFFSRQSLNLQCNVKIYENRF